MPNGQPPDTRDRVFVLPALGGAEMQVITGEGAVTYRVVEPEDGSGTLVWRPVEPVGAEPVSSPAVVFANDDVQCFGVLETRKADECDE